MKDKTGERACPFNYLYWDFLDRNEGGLKGLRRLNMPYNTLGKFSGERRDEIREDADRFLKSIGIR